MMRLMNRLFRLLLIVLLVVFLLYLAASWYAGQRALRFAESAGLGVEQEAVGARFLGFGWQHQYQGLVLSVEDLRLATGSEAQLSHRIIQPRRVGFAAPDGLSFTGPEGVELRIAELSSSLTVGLNQRIQGASLHLRDLVFELPGFAEIRIKRVDFDAIPRWGTTHYEGKLIGLTVSGPLAQELERSCLGPLFCLPSAAQEISITGRIEAYLPLADPQALRDWQADGGRILLEPLSIILANGGRLPELGFDIGLDAELYPEGNLSLCLTATADGTVTCSPVAILQDGELSAFGRTLGELPSLADR